MINLFENMPNLSSLTFNIRPIYLNGHEWEEIIRKHLPKIQRFRLRMYFQFPYDDNRQKQAEELLQTFRTTFWLEEHQWFVQCQWSPSYNQGFLYTLPYAFERFHFYSEYRFISTCPNEKDYWIYNPVWLLEHRHPKTSINQGLIPCHLRFPNVRHFEISFPFNENFSSIISSFIHLISLDITIQDEDSLHCQLPLLLDRLPTLHALSVNVCSRFLSTLFQINNTSIPRLCFKRCWSKRQCKAFEKSSLARQCEILFLGIKKRNYIFDLIKSMSNLRVLIIRCNDDKWKNRNLSSINDELVEWLQKFLPSTYSISRDREETSNIQLWIDE
jgi:hypothetical protein